MENKEPVTEDPVQNFLSRYPGLSEYRLKRQATGPNVKFCSFLVTLLFIVLTCLSLFLRRDLNLQYF